VHQSQDSVRAVANHSTEKISHATGETKDTAQPTPRSLSPGRTDSEPSVAFSRKEPRKDTSTAHTIMANLSGVAKYKTLPSSTMKREMEKEGRELAKEKESKRRDAKGEGKDDDMKNSYIGRLALFDCFSFSFSFLFFSSCSIFIIHNFIYFFLFIFFEIIYLLLI
jgi:hypothetical protein